MEHLHPERYNTYNSTRIARAGERSLLAVGVYGWFVGGGGEGAKLLSTACFATQSTITPLTARAINKMHIILFVEHLI